MALTTVQTLRCCDCKQEKLIRARGRCHPCYGRYYLSPEFEQIARQNPVRHSLSDVDGQARTATCRICGPVRVTAIKDYRGKTGYRCNTARARIKREGRARNAPSAGIRHATQEAAA